MVDQTPDLGQTYVHGQTREVARALLDAAAELGLDPQTTVRTTIAGFIVPEEVWDAASARVLADVAATDGTDPDPTTEF